MKKAYEFDEILNATTFTIPVKPDDPFYTDFSKFRGTFKERKVFRYFGINSSGTEFAVENLINKKVLFLAGHRGSGKTTELNNLVVKLSSPKTFYPIVCNLDENEVLNLNNIEFVDILILILEKLAEKLNNENIEISEDTIKSFHSWYSQRITEVNNAKKEELKIETELTMGFKIPSLLSLFGKLRASLSGTNETKEIIRTTFTNNYNEFATKFNQFIEEIAFELREKNIARDLIFIIDGFEKIGTLDMRKKVLLDDSTRLMMIKTNMIIALPIELMKEAANFHNFGKVENFPMIKLMEKNNEPCPKSVEKFKEFIYNRISKNLFSSEDVVENIIMYSGGSPRELLRIIHEAYMEAEEDVIDEEAVENGIQSIGAAAQYLTEQELKKLKELKEAIEINIEIPYDEILQTLLEKRIVFEYNSGSYKRVNPIIKETKIYKQYVEGEGINVDWGW